MCNVSSTYPAGFLVLYQLTPDWFIIFILTSMAKGRVEVVIMTFDLESEYSVLKAPQFCIHYNLLP